MAYNHAGWDYKISSLERNLRTDLGRNRERGGKLILYTMAGAMRPYLRKRP